MKSTIHKEELISFLLNLRTTLYKHPEFEELCRQIPAVVEYLQSHDVKFEDYVTTKRGRKSKRDVVELLIWAAKIIKKIYDLINGDTT